MLNTQNGYNLSFFWNFKYLWDSVTSVGTTRKFACSLLITIQIDTKLWAELINSFMRAVPMKKFQILMYDLIKLLMEKKYNKCIYYFLPSLLITLEFQSQFAILSKSQSSYPFKVQVNNFSSRIVFCNEASFYLNWAVHLHNNATSHTQRPNVSVGIFDRHVIGAFFIKVTTDKWLLLGFIYWKIYSVSEGEIFSAKNVNKLLTTSVISKMMHHLIMLFP